MSLPIVHIQELDIHPRIIDSTIEGGYKTAKQLLESSKANIKTRTGLKEKEVEQLIVCAAKSCCPNYKTAIEKVDENEPGHIEIGCLEFDKIMGGGFSVGKITEVAGESGIGKTLIGLTLAIRTQLNKCQGGLEKRVMYICTEHRFPLSRLQQILEGNHNLKSYNNEAFSDNIFVHHVADTRDLLNCIEYQLPSFIAKSNIGTIVIDSVAAVFRADESTHQRRSIKIQEFGYKLHSLATTYRVAVLAINQVTANFSSLGSDIMPALGLSWSNLVTTRIMLRKTPFSIASDERESSVRVSVAEIVFCPWLPRKTFTFIITKKGIKHVNPLSEELHLT